MCLSLGSFPVLSSSDVDFLGKPISYEETKRAFF